LTTLPGGGGVGGGGAATGRDGLAGIVIIRYLQ